ncbi:hypothetical protein AAVH_06270 [Aphelenchoides avenae]|nr:hypothetical protein AAVH_06270 [Aphelenchus avenae]
MNAQYTPNPRFPHLLRHEGFRYHLKTTDNDNKLGFYKCVRNSCWGRITFNPHMADYVVTRDHQHGRETNFWTA